MDHWTKVWIENRDPTMAQRRRDLEAALEQRIAEDVVKSIGISGPIKGRRANIMVVDDLIEPDVDQIIDDHEIERRIEEDEISRQMTGHFGDEPPKQIRSTLKAPENSSESVRFVWDNIRCLEEFVQHASGGFEDRCRTFDRAADCITESVRRLEAENAELKARLGITDPEPVTFDVERQSENVADAIGMRRHWGK